MIAPYVVKEGQRIVLWHRDGHATRVDGPETVWTLGRRVQPLDLYLAGPEEFMRVRGSDGVTSHHAGPVALWFYPLLHREIEVAQKLKLNANEAVIVYRTEAPKVTRRVERGPALLMPAPDEWLHQFSWHGADPKNPRRKRPSALRFEKLRVIPDQLYYDVENVRTADDALITVQLMVFFELVDIDGMLDRTHDPIADFINAATADVIDFAAARPFERFKEQTERLNETETYPQLSKRAEVIGYRITKIVYCGYEATSALQAMHDDAIESRTRLKLEAETEGQAQDLADLKQTREAERETERREQEAATVEHRNGLAAAERKAQLRLERLAEEQQLEVRQMANGQDLEQRQAQDAQRLQFLGGAAALKIDLTRYLVAQYQHPDRLIRIDGDMQAQFHLHDQDN